MHWSPRLNDSGDVCTGPSLEPLHALITFWTRTGRIICWMSSNLPKRPPDFRNAGLCNILIPSLRAFQLCQKQMLCHVRFLVCTSILLYLIMSHCHSSCYAVYHAPVVFLVALTTHTFDFFKCFTVLMYRYCV